MLTSSDLPTLEEFDEAGLQRVLRTHHPEASLLDQLFQHLGPVPQVIHRGPDVGPHRLLNQRVAIMSHAYDTRSADRWSDEGGPVATEAGTRDGA